MDEWGHGVMDKKEGILICVDDTRGEMPSTRSIPEKILNSLKYNYRATRANKLVE